MTNTLRGGGIKGSSEAIAKAPRVCRGIESAVLPEQNGRYPANSCAHAHDFVPRTLLSRVFVVAPDSKVVITTTRAEVE